MEKRVDSCLFPENIPLEKIRGVTLDSNIQEINCNRIIAEDGVQCGVTLLQPPAVAAVLGSSVNLSCHMHLNGVELVRVNLYWLIPGPNNKVKEYLHPKTKIESVRSRKSRLIYPEFRKDLSLTIDDVQLSYTDTYICETSLVIGQQNRKSIGTGTYLLVYDDLTSFMNDSAIICKVRVQAAKDVDLVWDLQGLEYNIRSSVIPDSDSSYWIISAMRDWSQRCPGNTTITCNLRYKGQSLVERSMEAACAGALHSPPHPVLLYVLILGNSFIILIIIIVIFFWVTNKRNIGARVEAPYAMFSATSTRKCNGRT
ncbi:uncharacterized protein ACNLHF_005680 [Anomaloglossus baeobatrachus]